MPSWESLVRDHHALAFRVARSVLRDDASAEDAVQNLYLRLLGDPGALERAVNLRAFVARGAVNAALDQRRGTGRKERHERAAARKEAVVNPVDAAARTELRAKVGELPDAERLAIELHYFHGLTKEEAAEALAVPAGTVSSRLHSGLQRLRGLLSGAAFAALLAVLESELSLCGAAEAVPKGIEERILGLRGASARGTGEAARLSPAGAKAAPKRTAAIVVGGALVALLLAVVASRSLRDGAGAPQPPGSPEATRGNPGASPVAESPATAPGAAPGPEATEVATTEETVLEGFLFQRGDGVFVRDVSAWDHLPRQTIWNARAEQLEAWRESLTIPGGMVKLPAPPATNFGAFLLHDGPADAAPAARVRLRVRAPRTPDPIPDPEPFSTVTYAPREAELLEVLDAEVLGSRWLLAWREMKAGLADLAEAWALPTGTDKRSRLLAAATRIAVAAEDARTARRGDPASRWRIAREAETLGGATDRLAEVGLDGLLPPWPTAEDLRAALLDAPGPEALRAALRGRWGEDALRLDTWVWRADGPGSHSWARIAIQDAVALDEDAFRALQAELAAAEENRAPREGTPAREEHARAARERAARFGLDLAELTRIDRETHLIDCGVAVLAVVPGSEAERLGVRAGDILWKTRARVDGKGGPALGDIPVWGPAALAGALEDDATLSPRVVALLVLREGALVELKALQ